MKIFVTLCAFLTLFVGYTLQVGVSPPKPGQNKDDDGEWPFEVYLTGGKVELNPLYGTSSYQVRRDKSDGQKKMSGFFELTRQIPCSTSVTMNTKVKNAGVWVDGFHNGPKPLSVYVQSIRNYVETFFDYINTTYECPFGPGTFALDNFVIDPRKLPKDTALGEYIVTHYFNIVGVEALIIEFKVALEKP